MNQVRNVMVALVLLALAGGPSLAAQRRASGQGASKPPSRNTGEIVTPQDFVAAVERLRAHPGFVADVEIAFFGAGPLHLRIALKGDRRWDEFAVLEDAPRVKSAAARTYKTQIISKAGSPSIALDPQRRVYAELPFGTALGPASVGPDQLLEMARQLPVVRITPLGPGTHAGHRVARYSLALEGGASAFELSVAPDLAGLPVSVRLKEPQGEASIQLSNVSLDVPDALFVVPADYRRVTFEEFGSAIRQLMAE